METVLIRTSSDPATVADRVRAALGPATGATVRDIAEEQRMINSSLTAVSLRGLTRIELAFAIILAASGAGLVLALGLDERRRTLAIAASLGRFCASWGRSCGARSASSCSVAWPVATSSAGESLTC